MMRSLAMFIVYSWAIIAGIAMLAYTQPIILAEIAGSIALWLGFCHLVVRGK